jgi:hypothetical protein
MAILVRRNVLLLGGYEPIGPVLRVEFITWATYTRGKEVVIHERFHLENEQNYKADQLVFVEVNEDELVAMRLEASIRAKPR